MTVNYCTHSKTHVHHALTDSCMQILSEDMKVVGCCSLLLAVLNVCSGFQFQRKYHDGVTLYNHASRTFTVYWDADIDQQTIYFAVNVSTTGWVGFGISPDGGMPRADVVIGWISRDGRQHFGVSRQLISLHAWSNVMHCMYAINFSATSVAKSLNVPKLNFQTITCY